MSAPSHPRRRAIGLARWALAPLVMLATIAVALDRAPLLALVNESPSLRKGVYVRVRAAPIERGDIVAIAQPASARLYLSGLGMPGDLRLLKRVRAVGGDRVCALGGLLQTPEAVVRINAHDRRGVALPAWRECRDLAGHELFLLGDTPSSFDSRYFGPIDRARVEGVYREMITW